MKYRVDLDLVSRRFLIFATAFVFCIVVSVQAFAQQEVDLLVLGGKVFRTEEADFKPNVGLAIKDGKFIDVEAVEKKYKAAKTIQLKDDDYVLPGIIDCHAHYNVRLIRKRREEYLVVPTVYLANGVTTTFSCGEFDPESMEKLRKQIQRGEKIGPNLINSGPYFGRARPGWRGMSQQEVYDEVDFWAGRGVGGFKAKAIGPRELKALIERAHHHKLTVTGHLDSGYRRSVNPRDAIKMGIDRIEHFLGGDAMPDTKSAYSSLPNITHDMDEFKKIVKTYVDTKTVFDATITAYGYFGSREKHYDYWFDEKSLFTPFVQERVSQRRHRVMTQFQNIFEAKQRTIRHYFEAGGIVSLGTDHFSNGEYLPGFGAHREMAVMVASGIPAKEVIKIATINGARALGIDQKRGSIKNGKAADLFVIKGDPIKDIKNTRTVHTVVSNGKPFKTKELLESVKGKLGPKDESEIRKW